MGLIVSDKCMFSQLVSAVAVFKGIFPHLKNTSGYRKFLFDVIYLYIYVCVLYNYIYIYIYIYWCVCVCMCVCVDVSVYVCVTRYLFKISYISNFSEPSVDYTCYIP